MPLTAQPNELTDPLTNPNAYALAKFREALANSAVNDRWKSECLQLSAAGIPGNIDALRALIQVASDEDSKS
jgi:hypothetical protein